jgi:6-phosphogluconolactonase (cycloisomerase 2 family)
MINLASRINRKQVAFILALLVAWLLAWSSGATARAESDNSDHSAPKAVYSLINAISGNAVAVFDRAANGNLRLNAYVFTGGIGTGAGLGSQQALVLENDWIFAVNAGSNSISALHVEPYGLRLTDTIDSGGFLPISLTAHDGLIYVLNAGGSAHSGNITGFRLSKQGQLSKIGNSTQPLSDSNVSPAQVSFSPNGRLLVVTEKGTNKLDSYQVADNGQAHGHKVFNSAGMTPFGFSFDGNNRLIVSEAFGGAALASAASSYRVSNDGTLEVVSASVATHQTAACWVTVSKNGRYAYTGNPTSDSLTGFKVANNGELTLLNSDGRTGTTAPGSAPQDEAISQDGRFLYVLDIKVGKISAFKIEQNGQLTALADFGGLPTGSVGLAAR